MSKTEARSSHSRSFTNASSSGKTGGKNSTATSAANATGFDVFRVYEQFLNALREPESSTSPIGTQDYINGYQELLKFFDQLGYIFKFVKDDVVDKLGILQRFVDHDPQGSHKFGTIQKAIDFELQNNLIRSNPENFARTLLRLHRALLFIIQLLRGLNERPQTESTSSIASSCYDATLYQHHPFLIRQSVKFGFLALPSRRQLDEVIFHGRKAELTEQYQSFMTTITKIYDTIQEYYSEKQLLDLP